MKRQFQSLWTLGTLATLLTLGVSLNAQQTASPTTSTDPAAAAPQSQPTQPTDPTAQQPATPPQSQSSPTAEQSGQQPSDSQAQPSRTPDQGGQAAPDSQGQPSASASDSQTFSGTVVKSADKYVLQDEASGKTYDIDHQEQLKQYEGKRVRVHGTLDASGKMIHVQ
jgi:outer membrane biosynthesis protein TonB